MIIRKSPYEKINSYEEFKLIPINQLGEIDVDINDDINSGYITKWFRKAQDELYQARVGNLITEENPNPKDELTPEEELFSIQELINIAKANNK